MCSAGIISWKKDMKRCDLIIAETLTAAELNYLKKNMQLLHLFFRFKINGISRDHNDIMDLREMNGNSG